MDRRETEHCELQDKYESCLEQNQSLVKEKNVLVLEAEEMREKVLEGQYTVSHLSAEASIHYNEYS